MWEPEMRYAQASTAHAPAKEHGPIRLAQARLRIFAAAVALAVLASTFGLAAPAVGSTGTCGATAASAFAAGAGTEQDPYRISNLAEFLLFASDSTKWGDHFLQTADIDMDGCAFTPIGSASSSFSGVYDGGGIHEIRNLTIVDHGTRSGMFGSVSNATIKNLAFDVTATSTTGGGTSGGLIGSVEGTWHSAGGGATVSNVSVDVDINMPDGGNVAGLIGETDGDVYIEDVVISGTVVAGRGFGTGGVIGQAYGNILDMRNVQMLADVTHDLGSSGIGAPVGGLIGGNFSNQTTIENVDVAGAISAVAENNVGGLIGFQDFGSLAITRATVHDDTTITALGHAGGLVGNVGSRVTDVTITRSSFLGSIDTPGTNLSGLVNIGGLIGYTNQTGDLTITDSHVFPAEDSNGDPVFAGDTNVGGLIGNAHNAASLTIARTTVQGFIEANTAAAGCLVAVFGTGVEDNTTITDSYWPQSVEVAGSKVMCDPVSPPALTMSGIPQLGRNVTIEYIDGYTPIGRFFDIWVCGSDAFDNDRRPNDDFSDADNRNCAPINFWFHAFNVAVGDSVTFQIATPTEDADGTAITTVPAINPATGQQWVNPNTGNELARINRVNYCGTATSPLEDVEDNPITGSLYLITHDYAHGLHSNWFGPIDCNEVSDPNQGLAGSSPSVTQPRPVAQPGSGRLPALPAGQGGVLIDGAPAQVTVDPVVRTGVAQGVKVSGDGFEIELDPADADATRGRGQVLDTQLLLVQGEGVQTRMSGFQPSSPATLWLFSEPELLGEFTVDASGNLDATVALLPDGVSACQHTVQVVGTLPGGGEIAANLGVWVVADPFPFTDTAAFSVHGPSVGCLESLGVVEGFGAERFSERARATRGQAATMIARLLDLPAATPTFSDSVTSTHAAGIGALQAAGLVNGFANGAFGPGTAITRGELATLVAAAYGLDAASSPFADAGETHAGAIGALYEAGVLSGFADGTFRPHAPITRGQLASVLVRAKYLLG